ncbi:MAG: hypothetical protein K6G44_07570 [Lentisphaeria bacterium]|nr:hypothetical protein [Lentisphaeria bacterium]
MPNQTPAKEVSDFVRSAVMYQLFLRPFTPEGTLKAAIRMLPHIASLGVDIVYLCPQMVADDDPRTEFWSDRQNASKMDNPYSPYRLKDYYHTDPEYGTDDDLRRFVTTAHSLGLLVMLDLVYYHCGPTAVFIEDHPDFVKRNEDGTVKNGKWHFPELNFDCPELREYLWKNMEYWVRDFDVDGFRTDVEAAVPEDFWEEGRRRIEAIKEDVIMLAESENPLATVNAYDISYGFTWAIAIRNVFIKKMPASHLIERWTAMRDKMPQGTLFLRNLENHDISMDLGDARWNMIGSPELVQAAMLLNFTIDGIPFIYNGEEIADNSHHCIFANRDHGKNLVIDWSLALSEVGENRLEFTKSLTTLRHGNIALQEGETVWLDNDRPEAVVSFLRTAEEQTVLTVVNTTDEPLTVAVKTECGNIDLWDELLASGVAWRRLPDGMARFDLLPYGYAVLNI